MKCLRQGAESDDKAHPSESDPDCRGNGPIAGGPRALPAGKTKSRTIAGRRRTQGICFAGRVDRASEGNGVPQEGKGEPGLNPGNTRRTGRYRPGGTFEVGNWKPLQSDLGHTLSYRISIGQRD